MPRMAKLQSKGHEVKYFGTKRKVLYVKYENLITIHSKVMIKVKIMIKVKVFADKRTNQNLYASEPPIKDMKNLQGRAE